MDTSTSSKSVVAAIHEKYEESSTDDAFFEIYVPKKSHGADSSGKLHLPSSLGLESYSITHAGDHMNLSTLCAHIKELDLSDNCVGSWDEVYKVLDALPSMELLNLTRNPLPQLTTPHGKRYDHIKKLVVNFTGLSWETVGNICTTMPCLEELYLSGNHYKSVTLDIPAYESLRLLQLTDNRLSDWRDVLKLDQLFPQLKNLILAHNDITSCGSAEENCSKFINLQVLNMNNTAICEWNELDKLAAIKSVSDIRLASVPLVQEMPDRKKLMQLLSVHFPQHRLVNGSPVVSDDLDTAERVYMRHFEHLPVKPDKFTQLEGKHGKLEKLADVDLKPSFYVSLVVECKERSRVFEVSTKDTVVQLRKSLRQFVGTSNFELSVNKMDGSPVFQLPSYSKRLIHTFQFEGGEKLICRPLDQE